MPGDHFSIGFVTGTGRTLRVRMHSEHNFRHFVVRGTALGVSTLIAPARITIPAVDNNRWLNSPSVLNSAKLSKGKPAVGYQAAKQNKRRFRPASFSQQL